MNLDDSFTTLSAAEIYDTAAGFITELSSMLTPRYRVVYKESLVMGGKF